MTSCCPRRKRPERSVSRIVKNGSVKQSAGRVNDDEISTYGLRAVSVSGDDVAETGDRGDGVGVHRRVQQSHIETDRHRAPCPHLRGRSKNPTDRSRRCIQLSIRAILACWRRHQRDGRNSGECALIDLDRRVHGRLCTVSSSAWAIAKRSDGPTTSSSAGSTGRCGTRSESDYSDWRSGRM